MTDKDDPAIDPVMRALSRTRGLPEGLTILPALPSATRRVDEALEARFSFELSEREVETFHAWEAEHIPVCTRRANDAMGMQYKFCFTKGTIGDVIVVRCACGEEKNVTDFASW